MAVDKLCSPSRMDVDDADASQISPSEDDMRFSRWRSIRRIPSRTCFSEVGRFTGSGGGGRCKSRASAAATLRFPLGLGTRPRGGSGGGDKFFLAMPSLLLTSIPPRTCPPPAVGGDVTASAIWRQRFRHPPCSPCSRNSAPRSRNSASREAVSQAQMYVPHLPKGWRKRNCKEPYCSFDNLSLASRGWIGRWDTWTSKQKAAAAVRRRIRCKPYYVCHNE